MFGEKHMRNVARELREAFDFFLSDQINPKIISVGDTYMDNLWCILIDNWLTIVPCMITKPMQGLSGSHFVGEVEGYELQVVTIESNYPNEPDWIDYAIIGSYTGETNVIDATLKYILNQAMEAYGENKCYAQTIMEDATASIC